MSASVKLQRGKRSDRQGPEMAVHVIRHWGRIADILHRQVVPQSMR